MEKDLSQTKLTQEYYLRAQDVDINGTWMPSAIFVRMQEIAEDNAAAVGAGRVDMIDALGYAWVLTRMYVEMEKYPRIGDTIKVSTWPLKPTKLYFSRQFLFEEEDGEILGKASSQWVLFDVNKRQIKRSTELGNYPHDPNLPRLLPEPKKLLLPKNVPVAKTETVLYSDVDMNVHMNNTKYLNWICELFSSEWLTSYYLKSIRINYIGETHIDQKVDLHKAEADDGFYIFGTSDGKMIFDSFTEWAPRAV